MPQLKPRLDRLRSALLRVCVVIAAWLPGCTAKPQSERAEVPILQRSRASALPAQSTQRVQFSLDSDSATLAPGGKIWLFATFVIPAGSHIYWLNPGESGLATSIAWTAPPGFTLGSTRYPGPQRFTGERGATNYGYAANATLAVEVTLPREVPATAEFGAQASWLACSDVCAQDHAEGILRLPLAQPLEASQAARARQSLPAPLPADAPAPQPEGERLILEAPVATRYLEFFSLIPLADGERACTSLAQRDGSAIVVDCAGRRAQARGVLRAERDGHELFYELDATQ